MSDPKTTPAPGTIVNGVQRFESGILVELGEFTGDANAVPSPLAATRHDAPELVTQFGSQVPEAPTPPVRTSFGPPALSEGQIALRRRAEEAHLPPEKRTPVDEYAGLNPEQAYNKRLENMWRTPGADNGCSPDFRGEPSLSGNYTGGLPW